MIIMLIIIILFLALSAILPIIFHYRYPELKWNWDSIDTDRINFPDGFIWGTATAAHQVEGNCNNNWSEFEKKTQKDGKPNIKDGQVSGNACEHWERYREDIELIKRIGVTHYRFSIEWSKIEPTIGQYDIDAIDHYSNVINHLLQNSITPVVTLHHFSHPIWFEEKGGFSKAENIAYFISFSKKVFSLYSDRVKDWCTINEPGVFAVQGYFTGMFPPGLKNTQLTAEVLKNLLEAHVQVYHALKNQKNGEESKIGIVKNINQFEPWRRRSIRDWLFSLSLNHVFNSSTLKFFKTGKFKIRLPGLMWKTHYNEKEKDSLDFFGLNYYSHNHLKFSLFKKDFSVLEFHKKDVMTDMPYAIYAEGIYRAIKFVSSLNVPIIITENGVADANDQIRETYIKKYIYAVSKAISEGANVVGYYYWSLMDNFEWAFGYDMKFGLYEVDFDNQERKLRDGSKAFVDIVRKNGKSI